MRKSIIVLSSFLFLLLLTSYAVAQECGCNACHGNPPVTGAHAKHAAESGATQNDVCYKCHWNGMPKTPVCGNNLFQIGFHAFDKCDPGALYDGKINPAIPYEATCDTKVTQIGSMTCSNIYCHSNGTGGTKNTGGITKSAFLNSINDPRPVAGGASPPWNSTGPIGCTGCHGYPPSYQMDQPKSDGHWHATDLASVTCATCHYDTTPDGTTIDTAKGKHMNGIYDIVPGPQIGWPPVSFTYIYDAGGGKCSNISCHGTGNYPKTWGNQGRTVYLSTSSGTGCFQVNFSAISAGGYSGIPPYTYEWDFGDEYRESGTSDTLPIASTHTYQVAGLGKHDYMVTFSFRDGNYHPGEKFIPISFTISNPYPPKAYKTVSVSGMTATLTDQSYDPDYNFCGHVGPGSITITWGDNTTTQEPIDLTNTASNKVYNHTYDAAGSYTIHHCVTDNLGATKCSTDTIITVPK